MTSYKTVRDWMRDVMARKEWSATAWARRGKVASSTITRFLADEKANPPTIKVLTKLADAADEALPLLGIDVAINSERLRKAMLAADHALAGHPTADATLRANVTSAIYEVIADREAQGEVIDDEAAKRLVNDLARRIIAASLGSSRP